MKFQAAICCSMLVSRICTAPVDAASTKIKRLRGLAEGLDDTSRLSFGQQVLGGGPIDPEDCPPIGPSDACVEPESDDETVSCRGCEYDTSCFAASAGFLLRRDCQLATLLGGGVFSNTVTCPPVPPTELCLDLTAPVVCGGCEYNNDCFAETAGYDIELECESVATPPPVDENFVNPVFASNCPIPDPSSFCFAIGNSIVCGPDACLYKSKCDAASSGWTISTECRPPPLDQDSCPPVSFNGNFCQAAEAVVCQEACEYASLCKATAAGFLLGDCGPIPEPEPEPDPDPEPEANNPNDSVVVNETDAPITAVQCDPDSCPSALLPVAFSCGITGDPVTCNDCCAYTNLCLAVGAGFNTQQCQLRDSLDTVAQEEQELEDELPDLDPSECPPLTDKIPCTGESGGVNEVSCRGCVYGNGCEAAGAGFTQGSCRLVADANIFESTPVPTSGPATARPTLGPTARPTLGPTGTAAPTSGVDETTSELTPEPTRELTREPTQEPTAGPTQEPTAGPTQEPTAGSTSGPTGTENPKADIAESTFTPTPGPTPGPTPEPTTAEPTQGPTAEPTSGPTAAPDPPTLPPSSGPTVFVCPEPTGSSCFVAFNPVDCSNGANDILCEYRSQCDAEQAGYTASECVRSSSVAVITTPVTSPSVTGNIDFTSPYQNPSISFGSSQAQFGPVTQFGSFGSFP